MAQYQINQINEAGKSAEVLFTANDGRTKTEVMADLPLHDAEATKLELSSRLNAWQAQLDANGDPLIDPALEGILLQPQEADPSASSEGEGQ